jgi:hypothetical protein
MIFNTTETSDKKVKRIKDAPADLSCLMGGFDDRDTNIYYQTLQEHKGNTNDSRSAIII